MMSLLFPKSVRFQSIPETIGGNSLFRGGNGNRNRNPTRPNNENSTVSASDPHRQQQRGRNAWWRSSRMLLVCFPLAMYAGLTLPFDVNMIRSLGFPSQNYSQLQETASSSSSLSSSSMLQQRFMPTNQFWRGKNQTLQMVWLMSFPNSGTSFTVKQIRHLGMTQTATNYGHDNLQLSTGEAVPVYGDQPGGPFWMDPDLHPEFSFPSQWVLVKTHCGGRCQSCPPQRYFESIYSFRQQCLTGKRRVVINNGTKIVDEKVSYPSERVTKAIHLIRDPFDNVVSRFHMESKGNRSANGYDLTREDFRQYCTWLNEEYKQDEENARILSNSNLLKLMKDVPCHADFFRYVEWHNQAFALTQDLHLETLVVHYGEYTSDMEGVSNRLLKFLDLSTRGASYEFEAGKVYRNEFYTEDERRTVYEAFLSMASRETWTNIATYFADEMTDDTGNSHNETQLDAIRHGARIDGNANESKQQETATRRRTP